MTPEESVILENHKASLQGYLDSSRAMIEYTKMSIRGALLLNGAGIIPIVASKVDSLYHAAIFFAVGAFFAVLTAGISYLVQWGITAGWATNLYLYPFRTRTMTDLEAKEVQILQCHSRCADCYLRRAAIASLAFSLIFFAVGLYNACSALIK